MASANFTVNGHAVPPEIAVSASSLVTLALLSISGVDTVQWSIIGNHAEDAVNPAITPAGTPLGATATFTMPAGDAQAYLIECKVNGGVDSEGVEQSSYVKTALVGVVNARGEVPFAFGEAFERSATHGTTEAFNKLAEAAGVGTGDVVGPGGSIANRLPVFADSTGKLLGDSGQTIAQVIAAGAAAAPQGDLKANGSVGLTADWAAGAHNITVTQDPGSANALARRSWIEAAIVAAVAGAGGGGGDGFAFTFSTTTTDADPGAGTLRINNATPGAGMTQIFVDLADTSSNDITAWLDRLDDSIGSVKGYIRVGSKSDKTKWLLFSLASVTTATGYRKLGVTYVAGPALPLTTAGDTFLSFESMGLIGLITNALVDPAAAIDWSKLASNAGNRSIEGVRLISLNGEINDGDSTAADTIDWTTGALHRSRLTAATVTFTYTAPPAFTPIQHRIVQDDTGGRAVVFPGTVLFPDGIAPPIETLGPDEELTVHGYYDGTNYRLTWDPSKVVAVKQESTTARGVPLTDNGALVKCTHASGCTITVPHSSTVKHRKGASVLYAQAGAGQVVLVPVNGNVQFLNSSTTHKTLQQRSVIGIIFDGTVAGVDYWWVCGEREMT